MGAEHVLGPAGQIPKGEGRNFDVGGTMIAVFRNHDGDIFATQAKCPHRAGPLADGLVGGKTLLCPLHELGFDLRTGGGLGHDACLAIYPATIGADGRIRVVV